MHDNKGKVAVKGLAVNSSEGSKYPQQVNLPYGCAAVDTAASSKQQQRKGALKKNERWSLRKTTTVPATCNTQDIEF